MQFELVGSVGTVAPVLCTSAASRHHRATSRDAGPWRTAVHRCVRLERSTCALSANWRRRAPTVRRDSQSSCRMSSELRKHCRARLPSQGSVLGVDGPVRARMGHRRNVTERCGIGGGGAGISRFLDHFLLWVAARCRHTGGLGMPALVLGRGVYRVSTAEVRFGSARGH